MIPNTLSLVVNVCLILRVRFNSASLSAVFQVLLGCSSCYSVYHGTVFPVDEKSVVTLFSPSYV